MRGVSANPSAGQPFLLYTDGDGREQRFSFEPGVAEASIGRERSADIVLGWDPEVSRLHARLERSEDDWTIVDDGLSSNGTFVNDRRISGRVRLADGDTLRLGATTLTFRAPPAVRRPAVAPVGGTPIDVDLSTSQRRVLAALCRPYTEGGGPAGDEQIAEQLFLPVDSVRTHLMVLSAKLGVDQAPPDQQRVQLVEKAVHGGLISERDL